MLKNKKILYVNNYSKVFTLKLFSLSYPYEITPHCWCCYYLKHFSSSHYRYLFDEFKLWKALHAGAKIMAVESCVRISVTILNISSRIFPYPNIWTQPIFDHRIVLITYVIDLVSIEKRRNSNRNDSVILRIILNLLIFPSKCVWIAVSKLLREFLSLKQSLYKLFISLRDYCNLLFDQALDYPRTRV